MDRIGDSMDKIYEIGIYEKAMPKGLTWREKFKIAKKNKFDYIEMSIDETEDKLLRLDMSQEERLNIIEDMYKENIKIRSICLSAHRKYPLGSKNKIIRDKSLEIMKKAIELADDLGIRIIQLAGYDVYYEEGDLETKELFKKNLKISVEMASKKGIILAFETMETEFMNTVSKSMVYVNEFKNPYLQIYPDCGNLTNAAKLYGSCVLDDLEVGKGHIVAMHLKETVIGKFREIEFGTGHVEFEKVIEKALDLGIRRFVLEFWCTDESRYEEDIEKSKKFIDDKFKAII